MKKESVVDSIVCTLTEECSAFFCWNENICIIKMDQTLVMLIIIAPCLHVMLFEGLEYAVVFQEQFCNFWMKREQAEMVVLWMKPEE